MHWLVLRLASLHIFEQNIISLKSQMLSAEEVLPVISFIYFPSQVFANMGNIIHYLYLIMRHLFNCKSFSAYSLLCFPNMVLQFGITVHSHYETQMSDRPIPSNSASKKSSAASLLLKFHTEKQDLFFEPLSVFHYLCYSFPKMSPTFSTVVNFCYNTCIKICLYVTQKTPSNSYRLLLLQ